MRKLTRGHWVTNKEYRLKKKTKGNYGHNHDSLTVCDKHCPTHPQYTGGI